MTARFVLTASLLLGAFIFPVWGQEQNAPRCGTDSAREHDDVRPQRTHVIAVKDADGKTHGVISPVKTLKVARLIFVGTPTLPISAQDEIGLSITARGYDDDKDGLDEVLERVRDGWQHHGYFKVEVEQSGIQTLGEDADTKTVAITMKVDAGKQYRLGDIHFDKRSSDGWRPMPGDHSTPQKPLEFTDQQLRAFFPIQEGEIFDSHKLQEGIVEIRNAYGSRGYINFTTLPSFTINEDANRITLLIELDEGTQYRYGNVEMTRMDSLVARNRLQAAGIVRGSVVNPSHFRELIEHDASLFPDDIERRIDEKTATVDVIIHARACDAP